MPSEPVLRPMRGLVTLLLVATALAPIVQAQAPNTAPQLTVSLADPGRAFVPGANETIEVLITYRLPPGARPAPAPTLERPENLTPTRITLSAKQIPSWATGATFDPPEVVIEYGLRDTTEAAKNARANMTLAIAPDAPALVREEAIVVADASSNGAVPAASSESPPLKLRVGPVARLNVSAEPTQLISGGRWSVVPFTVANLGNSDIVAKLNVTVKPENSQVEFPDTLELKVNESRVVEVRVRTPWNAAEIGELELEATPILDGEEAQAASTTVQVTGRSAVPASGIALVLAALAIAARRRR